MIIAIIITVYVRNPALLKKMIGLSFYAAVVTWIMERIRRWGIPETLFTRSEIGKMIYEGKAASNHRNL